MSCCVHPTTPRHPSNICVFTAAAILCDCAPYWFEIASGELEVKKLMHATNQSCRQQIYPSGHCTILAVTSEHTILFLPVDLPVVCRASVLGDSIPRHARSSDILIHYGNSLYIISAHIALQNIHGLVAIAITMIE